MKVEEFTRDILTHLLIPAGPMPTLSDPDGIYPYQSFVETSRRPVIKRYRFVSLENQFIRVEICPDLGGKVYSILHKKSGKEVLYVPGVVKHTRILPRFYFVAGGIEVSFPISHTPSQNETVHCRIEKSDSRIYVSVGETELRYGMQWTVEFSLAELDHYLTQRCRFYNPTAKAHQWMSWSNAAVTAHPDTQLHFPEGEVLLHEDKLVTVDWSSEGPKTNDDIKRMSGYFWRNPSSHSFGVFTPSVGIGLYHTAHLAEAPGIKLWSYGSGRDKDWSLLSCLKKESYLEIQGGPLADQSILSTLKPNSHHLHTEFWMPSDKPLDISRLNTPNPVLRSPEEIPLFPFLESRQLRPWLHLIASFEKDDVLSVGPAPSAHEGNWPPSGLVKLGEALDWITHEGSGETSEWQYFFGIWLAGTGNEKAAIEMLQKADTDMANAILGRLYYQKKSFQLSRKAFEKIQNLAVLRHPQIVFERDKTLEALGPDTVEIRNYWLEELNGLEDEWIVERRIALLLAIGQFKEARSLFEQTAFQKIHQRYERSKLWQQIASHFNLDNDVEKADAGEDNLAAFGAYRSFDGNGSAELS